MAISTPYRFHSSEGGGGYRLPKYLTDPESKQVMYRPVVQLDELPPVPEPGDTTSDAAKWWQEEWKRSTEGWTAPDGVWLNPIYYWYLNHVKIELVNQETGLEEMASPLYCDSDHETIESIYWCLTFSFQAGIIEKGTKRLKKKDQRKVKREEDKRAATVLSKHFVAATDLIATKGRRKHWSFINLCGVFLWAFTVDANAHLGVGFDCKDTREEGQRVFRGAYDRLHPFWKHAELYTDKEGELSACEWKQDDDGNVQKSEGYCIHFKEMDKRPGAFRGRRYRIILLDEAGKYMHLGKIIGSIRDCLRIGTRKFGTLLVGGTCDPITNKSDTYQRLWERAKAQGWVKHFIPAWKIAEPDVDWFTGKSDEETARGKYVAERQVYLDTGDMEQYHLTVQENPLDEHELFMLPTLSAYPSHLLLAQTMKIAGEGEDKTGLCSKLRRGRIDWELNAYDRPTGKARFVPDPNGPWLFTADYQPHKELIDLDVLGIDDVYKDNAPHSDSKCAMVLYRRFHNRLPDSSDMPVAVYFDRPLMDVFAEEVIKVMTFTGAKVILEYNAKYLADHIIKKHLDERLMYFNGEPGLRNSEGTIAQQTMIVLKWMSEGGLSRCWFTELINGFKNWRSGKNDDRASAFHQCMMGVDTLNSQAIDDDDSKKESTQAIGSTLFDFGLNGLDWAEAIEEWGSFGFDNPAWGNPFRKGGKSLSSLTSPIYSGIS